jgi:hypothetical protein
MWLPTTALLPHFIFAFGNRGQNLVGTRATASQVARLDRVEKRGQTRGSPSIGSAADPNGPTLGFYGETPWGLFGAKQFDFQAADVSLTQP